MICFGILSVQRENKHSLKRWIRPVKITDRFSAEADVIAAEISYTAEELAKMPKWLKKRIIEKGRKLLLKNGACCVVLENEKAEGSIRVPVLPKYIKACADYIIKRKGMAGRTAYIIDKKFENTAYGMLESICCNVKFISIVTENTAEADKMCSRLCDEYGVYPEVCGIEYKIPSGADVVIDCDKGYVRTGRDLIVDGVELEMNLHGYNADLYDIVKNVPAIKEKLSFKAWLSGKNQLTRMNS